MIFGSEETLLAVLEGRKTVTRRLSKTYRTGGIYTVQEGRGKKGVGQIEAIDVRQVRLGDIDEADARREGFSSVEAFRAYWEATHGDFDHDLLVSRIEFVLLGVRRPQLEVAI